LATALYIPVIPAFVNLASPKYSFMPCTSAKTQELFTKSLLLWDRHQLWVWSWLTNFTYDRAVSCFSNSVDNHIVRSV